MIEAEGVVKIIFNVYSSFKITRMCLLKHTSTAYLDG